MVRLRRHRVHLPPSPHRDTALEDPLAGGLHGQPPSLNASQRAIGTGSEGGVAGGCVKTRETGTRNHGIGGVL